MKIRDLKTFVVGNPPPTWGGRYFIFVKLTTDTGIEGIGEVYNASFGPQAMVTLLSGLYQGQWLSPASRDVLLGAMSRCQTGLRRMRAAVPEEALVGHKTGTLANTSSDVGMIRTPDGHTIAVAIYVTGQGSKPGRESRIQAITRAIYDGYQSGTGQQLAMGTR